MVAKTINKFYFINVGSDIKREIIDIIDKANEPPKIDKHPRRDLYKKLINDWYAGKFGDIGLPEACIKNKLDYLQVIRFKKLVDSEIGNEKNI